MRLLLDTHALAWWVLDDPNLSSVARSAIQTADVIFVSAVTVFEAETKHRLGKWPDARVMLGRLPEIMERSHIHALPVTMDHASTAGRLQAAHRDPFDRLLAAQALADQLVLVSRDPALAEFGVPTLW